MCLRDLRNVPTYHTASRSLAPQAQLDGLRLGLQVLLPCGGLGVSHLSKDRLHRFGVLEVLLPFPIEVPLINNTHGGRSLTLRVSRAPNTPSGHQRPLHAPAFPATAASAVDGGIAAVLPLRLTAGCMLNALRKEQQRFFV